MISALFNLLCIGSFATFGLTCSFIHKLCHKRYERKLLAIENGSCSCKVYTPSAEMASICKNTSNSFQNNNNPNQRKSIKDNRKSTTNSPNKISRCLCETVPNNRRLSRNSYSSVESQNSSSIQENNSFENGVKRNNCSCSKRKDNNTTSPTSVTLSYNSDVIDKIEICSTNSTLPNNLSICFNSCPGVCNTASKEESNNNEFKPNNGLTVSNCKCCKQKSTENLQNSIDTSGNNSALETNCCCSRTNSDVSKLIDTFKKNVPLENVSENISNLAQSNKLSTNSNLQQTDSASTFLDSSNSAIDFMGLSYYRSGNNNSDEDSCCIIQCEPQTDTLKYRNSEDISVDADVLNNICEIIDPDKLDSISSCEKKYFDSINLLQSNLSEGNCTQNRRDSSNLTQNRRNTSTLTQNRRDSPNLVQNRRESSNFPQNRRNSSKFTQNRRNSSNFPQNRRDSSNLSQNRRDSSNLPQNRRDSSNFPQNRRDSSNLPQNRRDSSNLPQYRRNSSKFIQNTSDYPNFSQRLSQKHKSSMTAPLCNNECESDCCTKCSCRQPIVPDDCQTNQTTEILPACKGCLTDCCLTCDCAIQTTVNRKKSQGPYRNEFNAVLTNNECETECPINCNYAHNVGQEKWERKSVNIGTCASECQKNCCTKCNCSQTLRSEIYKRKSEWTNTIAPAVCNSNCQTECCTKCGCQQTDAEIKNENRCNNECQTDCCTKCECSQTFPSKRYKRKSEWTNTIAPAVCNSNCQTDCCTKCGCQQTDDLNICGADNKNENTCNNECQTDCCTLCECSQTTVPLKDCANKSAEAINISSIKCCSECVGNCCSKCNCSLDVGLKSFDENSPNNNQKTSFCNEDQTDYDSNSPNINQNTTFCNEDEIHSVSNVIMNYSKTNLLKASDISSLNQNENTCSKECQIECCTKCKSSQTKVDFEDYTNKSATRNNICSTKCGSECVNNCCSKCSCSLAVKLESNECQTDIRSSLKRYSSQVNGLKFSDINPPNRDEYACNNECHTECCSKCECSQTVATENYRKLSDASNKMLATNDSSQSVKDCTETYTSEKSDLTMNNIKSSTTMMMKRTRVTRKCCSNCSNNDDEILVQGNIQINEMPQKPLKYVFQTQETDSTIRVHEFFLNVKQNGSGNKKNILGNYLLKLKLNSSNN